MSGLAEGVELVVEARFVEVAGRPDGGSVGLAGWGGEVGWAVAEGVFGFV